VCSCTVPLHLGDGTVGHVEQIWQRSHDTWCVRIRGIDGDWWARGESDPLKSCEEACMEWTACLMESGAGT
jgi:hypothetical protein